MNTANCGLPTQRLHGGIGANHRPAPYPHGLHCGHQGRITLPDFQYAEHMTLELDGQLPQELDFPFDVNGFEYQIREVSRCAATGRHHSSIIPRSKALP